MSVVPSPIIVRSPNTCNPLFSISTLHYLGLFVLPFCEYSNYVEHCSNFSTHTNDINLYIYLLSFFVAVAVHSFVMSTKKKLCW